MMARIRTIKPEFPHSESMGRVSRESRLCFIMLWTLADDSGRLRGNSRMLASLLFPYDDDAPKLINKWLCELEEEDCITCYEVDGNNYIQIRNWLIHQKIDKPSQSKIPEFDESSRILANPRESSSLDQGPRIKDQGKEGKVPSSVSHEKIVFDGSSFKNINGQLHIWKTAYPAIDVESEINKAAAWLVANPKNKKSQYSRFLNGWLSRAQDKAPRVETGGLGFDVSAIRD